MRMCAHKHVHMSGQPTKAIVYMGMSRVDSGHDFCSPLNRIGPVDVDLGTGCGSRAWVL